MIDNIYEIEGDSMKDIGLFNGMYVEVDPTKSPEISDIVVAEIDGKIFVKMYDSENSHIIFRSKNKLYADISNYTTYKILGVVVKRFLKN